MKDRSYHWVPFGLILLAACGTGEAPVEQEPLTLQEIVSARTAELSRTVTDAPPPTADSLEFTKELLQTRVHGGDYRHLALDDLTVMGQSAVLPLAQWAREGSLDSNLRQAAVELLGILAEGEAGAAATERLLQLATSGTQSWLRAHAAWRLGAAHSDHVVPRLALRLKYESDPEAFLWVASSLARKGCLAGLSGLIDLAGRKDDRAERASAELAWIADSLQASPAQLLHRWNSAEASAIPLTAPSEGLLAEVWFLVQDLSGDTFALRPVDDARHMLSQLGPWCAREIALALRDTDPFVRLHVAQVLERMGPRARDTESALITALGIGQTAPAMAEALGAVGSDMALTALLAVTGEDTDHELRVAAVRGLGDLGLAGALTPIDRIFNELASQPRDQLQDLRMACAKALVQLDGAAPAISWLMQAMQQGPDPTEAERALEIWLQRGTASSRQGFAGALKTWKDAADPPGSIPSTQRAEKRRARRAQQLSTALELLLMP